MVQLEQPQKLGKRRLLAAEAAKKVIGYVRLKRLRSPPLDASPQFSRFELARSMQLQSVRCILLQLFQASLASLLERLPIKLKEVACGNRATIELLLCLPPKRR